MVSRAVETDMPESTVAMQDKTEGLLRNRLIDSRPTSCLQVSLLKCEPTVVVKSSFPLATFMSAIFEKVESMVSMPMI